MNLTPGQIIGKVLADTFGNIIFISLSTLIILGIAGYIRFIAIVLFVGFAIFATLSTLQVLLTGILPWVILFPVSIYNAVKGDFETGRHQAILFPMVLCRTVEATLSLFCLFFLYTKIFQNSL